MIVRTACPACGSARCKKHGHPRHGKQKHPCQACPRQLVRCSEPSRLSAATRALGERLRLARIPVRGMCRAVGVGLTWLLGFLGQCFETLLDHPHVQSVTCHGQVMLHRLAGEADAMASFVQKQANQQWSWSAMAATTRQGIALCKHEAGLRQRSILVENADGPGPYGAKGIGESRLMPTAPVLANALARAIGVRLKELPLTPERVRAALARVAAAVGRDVP